MSSHGSTLALLITAVLATGASCKTKPQPTPVEQKQTALPKDGAPFGDAVTIEVGDHETCVITSSETLYCAGGERFGTHSELSMARPVKAVQRTRQVSLGGSVGCAVQQDGALVCWGEGSHVVPDGTPADGFARIPGVSAASHVLVPRGPHPPWVLRHDSPTPMICGSNTLDPGFVPPHEAEGVRIAGADVQQVEVGWELCVRTTAGEVLCWDGSWFRRGSYQLRSPVTFLPQQVVDIAAAWQSDNSNPLCALGADGRAVCWTYEKRPKPEPFYPDEGSSPIPIEHPFETVSDWRDIAMAFDHSCGVKRDGSVWCVGRNDKGQLGTPTPARSAALQRVPEVADAKAVDVGKDHSCALLMNGTVKCWGGNWLGQCGTAKRSDSIAPTTMLKYVGPGS